MNPFTWLKVRRLPRRGLKLHLGSGSVRLAGWVNIDLHTPQADFHWDIRRPLPFPAGAAQFVYHEHVIEHITLDEGVRCLADWYRVLAPGGVLRIATPDLEYLVERYGSGDAWRKQAWLEQREYQFIGTPAEMLNVALRWWGHQYVYDGEELTRRLRNAGFRDITRHAFGASDRPELRGLETRQDSMLILEAVRP